MIEHVHVCRTTEPVAPDMTYLRHMDELLDLRVGHLPVLAASGEWRLRLMQMTRDSGEWEYHAGRGYPIPEGRYIGLFHGQIRASTIWMSDVPLEVWMMWDAIKVLRDPGCRRVLITGLGLGIIVKHALLQPHIQRVDVVELSDDVLRLIRPHYRDRRLHVHCGDALTIELGPRRTWDLIYHDFWQSITAANLVTMHTVMERYAGRAGRQLCWQQATCIRMAREEEEHWQFPPEGIAALERRLTALGGADGTLPPSGNSSV
ncbi:MAG TPA: hypothetical protein VLA19_15975 [Herpetosiphonaceae bacterium]|nr:hypothetical protein [Herpetosiphonaceae bacterium]